MPTKLRFRLLLFIGLLLIFSSPAYSQCACCAGAASGSAFGDINNGILTLSKKKFAVELYGDYRVMNTSGQNPAPEDQIIVHGSHTHVVAADHSHDEVLLEDMLITSLGIRYGVTDKFMLSALLPYTFLYTGEGDDYGLGDLVMTGTYNFFNQSSWSIAAIGGVELPTGVQKDATFDNTTVVLGSGSVDPMAGVAFSKRWNKVVLYGNGLYKFTTTGFNDNYYGDLSVQNISLSYTLKGADASCEPDSVSQLKTDFNWTVSAGYYGEWLDKITEEGAVDENSGYYLGYATVATKLSWNTWSIPLTFSIPVYQQLNGEQHAAGNRFRIGVVKMF